MMKEEAQGKKKLWYRILRVLLRLFVCIIVLLIVLVLAINIPAVQTFIAERFIKSLREKTGTEISLGLVKITLPNTVNLTELYLQDLNKDTLLYLQSVNLKIDLLSLLHNEVNVGSLKLDNLVANIHRSENEKTFNFQFIIDVFSPDTNEKSDTNKKQGAPWILDVKDIDLKNIRATFLDDRAGIDARIDLGDLEATVKDFDMHKQVLDIGKVLLKNTSIQLSLTKPDGDKMVTVIATDSIAIAGSRFKSQDAASYFPDWNISAAQLTIENTNFRFHNASFPRLPEGIDFQHLFVSNLNTGIHNINIDSHGYRAEIINISFTESCGFNLKKFTAGVQLTDQRAELKNLQIETSESTISGNAVLGYSDFKYLLTDFRNCKAILNLYSTKINADEVFMFAPFLSYDKYASKFKNSDVFIDASATGKINDLDIGNLEVSLLKRTILKTKGSLTGLPDVSKLGFDATIDMFTTNLSDVYQFIDPAVFSGLKLPETFELKGTSKGNIHSMRADVELKSAYGNLAADAFYQTNGPGQRDTFTIDFTVQNMQAGIILADSMLGKCNFSVTASGSGISNGQLSGSATVDIHEAQYNAYTYSDIQVEGRMHENVISATAISADTNLNFNLTAIADLREAKQKYNARLDLAMMNLHALNFTEKNIAITTNVAAELNYAGVTNSDATFGLMNTWLIGNKKTVPLKKFELSAFSAPDSLKIHINSDIADGTISGNISPENLKKTFQTACRKYFGIADTNHVEAGKQLAFQMNMHIPVEFAGFLMPELAALNISKLEGTYSSDNNGLLVEMQVPEAVYSGVRLNTLSMVIRGINDSLSMALDLDKLAYDSIYVENIKVREHIVNGEIMSEIKILDSVGNPRYLFANKIEPGSDILKLRFLPGGLILDGEPWNIEEGNVLEKHKDRLITDQFAFSKDAQSFGVITEEGIQKLEFKHFALQNLINIVEFKGKERLVKGDLDGEVDLSLSDNQQYINASLAIKQLYIRDTLVGNLVVDVRTQNDRMNIKSRLESEQNKIMINGEVDHLSGMPLLDMNIMLDINSLHLIEQFSFGYLSEMSGKVDGEIAIKGTSEKPEINGFVGFENTAFKVNSLNFHARISDEKILLDTKGIHFNDFVIEDAQNKNLTLNGSVLTNNYKDFGYDLHLVTKDFQPINSTVADNPLFFGKLSLDADVKLKGDSKSPIIESDVKINSATDLTYALPGSELKLVSSEGVVKFLDRSQAYDSVFTAQQSDYITDSVISRLTGIDFSLNLEITPEAKFKVDIDPKSGDYLTLSGSAKLSIAADATGKQSISGTYQVTSGFYQLSFYGLVKKSFTILPGSIVSWSGRPMDADLNITARNIVRTSSVSLVANETASMSDAEKNIFKQRLPYEVKLNIRGFLAKPEISFNISLPEKDLVTYPLVATKLTQLNSEEMTSQLNKQVFALLVTGSFMADDPMSSTGSSPTNLATTAARNSVNGIMADQLNNISSRFISNVDVNFGLTTYEDYTEGSSDTRTDLDVQVSKKLFNDRLTVEAMSSFNLQGDKNTSATSSSDYTSTEFAVIYELTEDGEYKLRAYYENIYDLFEGELSYSGIALIFEREFDSLKRQKNRDNDAKKKKK